MNIYAPLTEFFCRNCRRWQRRWMHKCEVQP